MLKGISELNHYGLILFFKGVMNSYISIIQNDTQSYLSIS